MAAKEFRDCRSQCNGKQGHGTEDRSRNQVMNTEIAGIYRWDEAERENITVRGWYAEHASRTFPWTVYGQTRGRGHIHTLLATQYQPVDHF